MEAMTTVLPVTESVRFILLFPSMTDSYADIDKQEIKPLSDFTTAARTRPILVPLHPFVLPIDTSFLSLGQTNL